MTIWLKQSTACTIMFGPFVDKTDGVTLKTDATTITDIDHATTGIFLSKNGGAAAIRHQAVTASVADAYGMMKVTLDTTDTGTLGSLDVLFAKAATYLPVHKSFEVVAANVYDSIIGGGDVLDVSAIQFSGQTITAAAGVTMPGTVASTTNITAASGVSLAAGQKVDVDTIKTNPVVNGGTVTFPTNATLASTTNITGGTITTTTNVTNAVTISSGTGAGQLDITSGVVKSNMTQIDGQATNGNNATLKLKQLSIINNVSGPAVQFNSASAQGLTVSSGTDVGISITGFTAGMYIGSLSDALFIESYGTGKSIIASQDIAVSDGDLTLANIASAPLDQTNGIETGLTLREAMRLVVASLAGKLSGAATTTITIRNAVVDDTDRIIATVDSDGNRTAFTYDVT